MQINIFFEMSVSTEIDIKISMTHFTSCHGWMKPLQGVQQHKSLFFFVSGLYRVLGYTSIFCWGDSDGDYVKYFLSLKSTTRLWINFNLCNYYFCIAHLYIYPTCRLFLRTARFHWSRKVYLYFNHCIIAEKKEREKNSTWNNLFFLFEESRLLSGGNSHQIWSVTSQHVVRLASDSRQHYFP